MSGGTASASAVTRIRPPDAESLATGMTRAIESALAALGDRAQDEKPLTSTRVTRVGRVKRCADGVAEVEGLTTPAAGELVDVDGVLARVEAFRDELTLVVQLGPGVMSAGAVVRRLDRLLLVPTGESVLGRVIDPLGRVLDGAPQPTWRATIPIEAEIVPLADREPVRRPLRTGVFVVDTMVPIGLGQRQLVIGDRSTGKTELALDILSGLDDGIVGVYVGIGRRSSEIREHLARLRGAGFFQRGFAVVADSDAPLGMIHLAPYAACAIAEQLALAGRDVVMVLDSLTTHAHAHRSLALLLGRPVGREAYPVDIFHAHAKLLERAGQFAAHRGGGSLTALPIVETRSGDLSAYIPTNIVSITDGQVRLDARLHAAGQTPAVDVGLSVSRVGGKAQPKLVRSLAGSLKNDYALFLELETFARFGTRLEASAEARVEWGRRVRAVLDQPHGTVLGWGDLVVRALAVQIDGFAQIPSARVATLMHRLVERVRTDEPELWRRIDRATNVDGSELARLRGLVEALFTAARSETTSDPSTMDLSREVTTDRVTTPSAQPEGTSP